MTFGEIIAEGRKKANLSQKELANLIKKEDGESISPQYLNDLERDRRNPPSDFLIKQFAKVLDLELDVLYYCAGKLPADVMSAKADKEKVVAAYKAFRKVLNK